MTGPALVDVVTSERMNLLTERVAVTGILVERGGIRGIYVKKMEKAE